MNTVRLDCARMTDRGAAHDYLKKALGFPSWYGRNLDALFDLLGELGPTRLVLENVSALEALGPYGQALLSTLRDAAEENPALELCL
jgi:ribonuclease inhibitor